MATNSQAAMPGEDILADIPMTHTTTLLYKSRDGEIKELKVVQPLEPRSVKLSFSDLQILGREIARVLKEDA